MKQIQAFEGCLYIDIVSNNYYIYTQGNWVIDDKHGLKHSYGVSTLPYYINIYTHKLCWRREWLIQDEWDEIDIHLGYGSGPPNEHTLVNTEDENIGMFFHLGGGSTQKFSRRGNKLTS